MKFLHRNYLILCVILTFLLIWFGTYYFADPNNYGVANPAILTQNKNVVCAPRYASSVRNVSESLKREVSEDYGLSWPPQGKFVIDHKINLGIGGSNDKSNLIPQETLEARKKDGVEVYLQSQVCGGKMSVKEAKKAIKNWKPIYEKIKNNLGAVGEYCEGGCE